MKKKIQKTTKGDGAVLTVGFFKSYLNQQLDEKLDKKFEEFALIVKKGFDAVDERFDQVDERFEKIDERFTEIDLKLSGMDQRIRSIDSRMDDFAENYVRKPTTTS